MSGEIIKFDFVNKKIIETEHASEEPSKENKINKTEGDENEQHGRLIMLLLDKHGFEELKRLRFSPSTFVQNQELVKGYTTNELFVFLETTNEDEWKKKPAFFRAIFAELERRVSKE